MTRTFAITLAALATVFAGCGGLGDPDANNDVLTTYSGSLTDPDGLTIEGELRVALIWFGGNFAEVKTPLAASVDVPVVPQFPAGFDLPLDSPPPLDVLTTYDMLETDEELEAWPEGSSYSMGTVVVYDDRNLNGTLDLIGSGEEAIDRIVGVDPEILVLYVEGGVPELGEVFDQIQLGYNLVTLERCEEGDECLVRLVPIESVALALGDDPNAQRLMCREAPSFEISSPGIINMGAEVPEQWPAEDDVVQCAGDGSWYRHLDCDFEGSDICSETSNACVMRHWNLQPGPVPTEWPCDVEG